MHTKPYTGPRRYTNMDRGLINAILFIDLKKAFDNH